MQPSIARAAFYNLFLDAYEAEGAPVERWMEDARLPHSMRETPDAYVSSRQFLSFLVGAERIVGITDLSGDAMRSLSLNTLSPATQNAIRRAPTLHQAIQAFIRWARVENNEQNYWFVDHSHKVGRVVSKANLARQSYHSNFLQNWAVISVARTFLGPSWTPPDIGFQSAVPPGGHIYDDLKDTVFHQFQPYAWVTISKRDLARQLPQVPVDFSADFALHSPSAPVTAAAAVREVVKPFLQDGSAITIAEISDVLTISTRTLQRMLRRNGSSFRQELGAARVELAHAWLQDKGARVTDVAMALGYSDSSHFSRAFRKHTGSSPREFRDMT